jgi:hypothetical protein
MDSEAEIMWDMMRGAVKDMAVNLGQLPVETFDDPSVLFYGDVPEDRSDIHIILEDEFDTMRKFKEHVGACTYTLQQGLSIRYLDDYGELTMDQLRVLDHMYGVMVQWAARRKENTDHLLDVGLLTVETELPVLEETRFVGNDILVNLGKMAKALFQSNPVTATKKKWEAFESGARLLMPAPNLHIINREMEEGIQPFHNFDMKFGGVVGWYRLECAVKQLAEDAELMHDSLRPGWRSECKKVLAEDLDEFEAALHTFRRVIEDDKKQKVRDKLAETRSVYKL